MKIPEDDNQKNSSGIFWGWLEFVKSGIFLVLQMLQRYKSYSAKG